MVWLSQLGLARVRLSGRVRLNRVRMGVSLRGTMLHLLSSWHGKNRGGSSGDGDA